jgi:YegS/Rv2252/BmrU family lipid kinase
VTRAVVIVNPASGGGRTEGLWRELRDDLQRIGLAFDWAPTTGRSNAIDLARAAASAGAELIVAVGGDGTLNEVVNGATRESGESPVIGAILTGRGRDASRNFGLSLDVRAAARALVQGTDARFDLVRGEWADGTRRYAVTAAGAGFDGAVARRSVVGGRRGTLPYVSAILKSLAAHATVMTEIEADGVVAWSGRISTVVVANGAYYGGGMKIAPGADAADGHLDCVVLGDFGRLEFLWWLPTVYRGTHLASAKVVTRRARRLTIRPVSPLPVHVDGEPAGDTPVTFEIRPGALRLRR